MTITQLIKELEEIKKKEGDLPVVWESMARTWPVELKIKGISDKYLIVNS